MICDFSIFKQYIFIQQRAGQFAFLGKACPKGKEIITPDEPTHVRALPVGATLALKKKNNNSLTEGS